MLGRGVSERSRAGDELLSELGLHRADFDELMMHGGGFYELRDEDDGGALKQAGWFENLITDTGDQYYGERASYLTLPAKIYRSIGTMSAATNANPSVVTLTAHGLGVGDVVQIGSVTPAAGATGLNGIFVVTAVTANTFSVVGFTGAAGPGVWSSGGDVKGPNLATATGMKLGTGSTAVAKNGAGAALVTYVAASQQVFDSSFPASSSSSGRRIQYKTTYAAGTATASGLNEVVIVCEGVLTDATSAAGFTISRALLSPVVNKGASDSLAITWNHTLLGA